MQRFPGNPVDKLGVGHQRLHHLSTSGGIPQENGVVATTRGQGQSIGRPRYALYPMFVAHAGEFGSLGVNVPEAHCAVATPAGQFTAIRTKI